MTSHSSAAPTFGRPKRHRIASHNRPKVSATREPFRNRGNAMNTKSRVRLPWKKQTAFAEQVAQRVKDGIPIGTPRDAAENWVVEHFRSMPSFHLSNRAIEKSLWERAGVPENVPGGVICCLATRSDLIGRLLDRFWPNHVFMFLLLDNRCQVQDYRFLSFSEWAKMERQEAAVGG